MHPLRTDVRTVRVDSNGGRSDGDDDNEQTTGSGSDTDSNRGDDGGYVPSSIATSRPLDIPRQSSIGSTSSGGSRRSSVVPLQNYASTSNSSQSNANSFITPKAATAALSSAQAAAARRMSFSQQCIVAAQQSDSAYATVHAAGTSIGGSHSSMRNPSYVPYSSSINSAALPTAVPLVAQHLGRNVSAPSPHSLITSEHARRSSLNPPPPVPAAYAVHSTNGSWGSLPPSSPASLHLSPSCLSPSPTTPSPYYSSPTSYPLMPNSASSTSTSAAATPLGPNLHSTSSSSYMRSPIPSVLSSTSSSSHHSVQQLQKTSIQVEEVTTYESVAKWPPHLQQQQQQRRDSTGQRKQMRFRTDDEQALYEHAQHQQGEDGRSSHHQRGRLPEEEEEDENGFPFSLHTNNNQPSTEEAGFEMEFDEFEQE